MVMGSSLWFAIQRPAIKCPSLCFMYILIRLIYSRSPAFLLQFCIDFHRGSFYSNCISMNIYQTIIFVCIDVAGYVACLGYAVKTRRPPLETPLLVREIHITLIKMTNYNVGGFTYWRSRDGEQLLINS